jgi:NADH:ubiquinone oxidoreductase subunit F (NADH-binding)
MQVKILSAKFDIEDAHAIDVAKKHGAYATLDKLFTMDPAEVTAIVKEERVARAWRCRFSCRGEMDVSSERAAVNRSILRQLR